MDANMPDARLASTYTAVMLQDFANEMNSRKRNNASYNAMTSGIPLFPGPATSTESAGEKRYDAWNRKTLDKTKFDILKEEKHYNIWKQGFEAELALQKMSRAIDPAFDPSFLTCSYEKEL